MYLFFLYAIAWLIFWIKRIISHARSFLSEYNYSEGFIGSPVKDRNKLKRVVKVWSQFYACISSLHIKMELDSKNRNYRCESTCFGY